MSSTIFGKSMFRTPVVNPYENISTGSYSLPVGERITVLKKLIVDYQSELDKLTLDRPLPSPTPRMLNTHTSLKNAYEEMLSISKLVGVELSTGI